MICSLVGYSRFESKQGRACLILCIGYVDSRWQGLKVEQKFVDPSLVLFELNPGMDLIIQCDLSGRICSIKPGK